MPVLLGVKDAAIPKSAKTSSFINKIGGYPDHFTEPPAIPKCSMCQQPMCQIVQLYCPLMQSPYHRTLHIFSCINTICWGKSSCWKIFREQNQDTTNTLNSSETETKSTIVDCWGSDDNTWDDDIEIIEWSEQSNGLTVSQNVNDIANMMDNKCNLGQHDTEVESTEYDIPREEEISNYFSSEILVKDIPTLSKENILHLQKMTSSSYQKGLLNLKDKLCLKSYYLNVYEEPMETTRPEHIQHLLKNYKEREGKAYQQMINEAKLGKNCGGCTESYERTIVQHGNRTFYKFYKIISKWPEQCVRYELGGKPVTLTKNAPDPGSCHYCKANRQFEFQLMPALVKDLTLIGSNDCAVEFGTVISYTCSKSCWDDQKDTWREEECFVQNEQSL